MSTETPIATAQPGSIILFSGAAGVYYDAYDQAGRYLGYFGSKESAESALEQAAIDSSKQQSPQQRCH